MLTSEELHLLAKNPLFNGIRLEELPEALSCLSAEKRSFSKGSLIFAEGDPAETAFFVLKGNVDLVRYTLTGESQLLESFGQAEVFGEAYAIKEKAVYGLNAYAKEDSDILYLHLDELYSRESCGFGVLLLKNLAIALADKTLLLKQKLTIVTQKGLEAKVLEYLDCYSSKSGEAFFIPHTREEMAEYLGCERSALSRLLSEMAKKGLITYHRNRFVLNPKKKK